MRLWTLHPRYLDTRGLVALWREALLAQKVLRGKTRGYRAHPQLIRFRSQPNPVASIATYLRAIHAEAVARGYRFDARKIARAAASTCMSETSGQLAYEWLHLKRKLRARSPAQARVVAAIKRPDPHPSFKLIRGGVRPWERPRTPRARPAARRGPTR